MINSETCNGSDLAACPSTEPPTVDVGGSPDYIDVDQATRTAYVTTIGALNGWTVFNADTCNAVVQSGCTSSGYLAGDGAGPMPARWTGRTTLCTRPSRQPDLGVRPEPLPRGRPRRLLHRPRGDRLAVPPSRANAFYVAVDLALHSVYVTYQQDDEAAVVDTDVCNGSSVAACAALDPPLADTGGDPEGVVLDPQIQTLYTANEVDNDVSVIAASRCNAEVTRGCYQDPPGAPVGALGSGSRVKGLAVDPAVSTLYATTANNTVAMVDTQSCNSHVREGCPTTPPEVSVRASRTAIALDPLTHTVYVANGSLPGPGNVSVVNADTCNATDQAGCTTLQKLQVPGNPSDIAIDAATGTIYVAAITDSGPELAVFNGATCNATITAGCNQSPATLHVDTVGFQLNIAVDQTTNPVLRHQRRYLVVAVDQPGRVHGRWRHLRRHEHDGLRAGSGAHGARAELDLCHRAGDNTLGDRRR